MTKMNTGPAVLWILGGLAWFAGLLLLAVLGPGARITPKPTAKQFFTATQYQILYGQPKFDAQNPNPKFALNPKQVAELKSWDLNDCVATDGTAKQDSPSACFCENSPAVKAVFDKSWPVQPWNTWSTLPLSLMGLLILAFLVFSNPSERANLMTVTYFFAICYAFMTIALGPLSMMLHVGLRNVGGWFDSMSLYVWFGFVACYGWFRFILDRRSIAPDQCSKTAKGLFFLAWMGAIAIPALLTLPNHSVIGAELLYVILGGAALLGEFFLYLPRAANWILQIPVLGLLFRWLQSVIGAPDATGTSWSSDSTWDLGGKTWFAIGGGTFLVALIIWVLSFTKMPLCAPYSIQGHAIFHTLSAFAAGFLYKYYRHEGEA
jgi:hypothetical protein